MKLGYMDLYIYRERERETCVYIYIYTHSLRDIGIHWGHSRIIGFVHGLCGCIGIYRNVEPRDLFSK